MRVRPQQLQQSGSCGKKLECHLPASWQHCHGSCNMTSLSTCSMSPVAMGNLADIAVSSRHGAFQSCRITCLLVRA